MPEKFNPEEPNKDFKAQIPDLRNVDFDRQLVRMEAEDYGLGAARRPHLTETKWIQDTKALRNLPVFMTDRVKNRLSDENLQYAAEQLFSDPRAAKDFNILLSTHLITQNNLEETAHRLDAPLRADDPTERMLRSMFPEMADEAADVEKYNFAKVFLNTETPSEKRLELVDLHIAALETAQAQLDTTKEQLKQDFLRDLHKAVEDGKLPPEALPEASTPRHTRFEQLTVHVSDPVVNRLLDRGGHFNALDNAIHIDAVTVYNPERLRTTFYHEMLHGLSGMSIRVESPDNDEDDLFELSDDVMNEFLSSPMNATINAPHIGLRSGQFNVVNEAYTEWATMELLGRGYDQAALWADFLGKNVSSVLSGERLTEISDLYNKYGSIYLPNRVLQAGLTQTGILMQTIGAAYFESYQPKTTNPDREPGEAATARKQFDEAIASNTPFSSLRQMLTKLNVESDKAETDDPNWYEVALFAKYIDMQHN